jgi:cell division protein FtsQ
MESVLAARLRRPPVSPLAGIGLRAKLTRRTLLISLLAAVALAGAFMLFRSSPLVAVQQIEITGVHGVQAAPISEALDRAAARMSTMDYSAGALEAAVAQYPVVRSLKVSTSFPHRMRIVVSEQLPVARLSAGGLHAAVAADGVVLGPSLASSSLPTIPASVVPTVGRRVGGARLRSYLAVLGAAPAPLLPLISRVYVGAQGLTVKMANGLLVYFGDDSRPHAKWDSLVTVLSAPSSASASYVDVRLPERPAAGVPSGGVGSGESGEVSASDPTSAALAASLARAVNGESSTSPVTPSTPPATTEPRSSATASEPAATSQSSEAAESASGAAEGG